jgi:hypothetical protein
MFAIDKGTRAPVNNNILMEDLQATHDTSSASSTATMSTFVMSLTG